jgi:two-component system, chemotaxis family, sensor kinase CheA
MLYDRGYYMNNDLTDFKELYFKTAHEYVNELNTGMGSLGPNPTPEKFADLHRFAHSLKSQSAVMQFTNLAELAGTLEQLFYQLQQGEQKLTPDMMAQINESINAMNNSLTELDPNSPEQTQP